MKILLGRESHGNSLVILGKTDMHIHCSGFPDRISALKENHCMCYEVPFVTLALATMSIFFSSLTIKYWLFLPSSGELIF